MSTMKHLLALPLLGLLAASPDTQQAPYCQNDPTWSRKLLIIAEYDLDDADTHWEVSFSESKLEELRTDTGEVLEPEMFTPEIVGPGDRDPRVDGFKDLGEGQRLMVWEFYRPKQDWSSLVRLAGSYELIHGGTEHWIPVPVDGEPDAEPVPWENEHLAAAGFELKQGLRTVPQLQVKAKVAMGVLDEFILRDAEGEELSSRSSSGDLTTRTEEWNMDEEHDLSTLQLVVRFEDGSELVVDELPDGPKFQRIKGSEWKKKKMVLEVALVETLTAYTVGSYTGHESGGPKSVAAYRGYRWADSRGRDLDIFTLSEGGGSSRFSSSCPILTDPPRGARLELGILVGARSERVEFEFTDLPAPR